MFQLLLIFLLSYPDSARVIGSTHNSGGLGGAVGNRVSVRDSRGWIHAVYSTGAGIPYADSTEIFYVYSTDNGQTWSAPMNVSRTDSLSSDEPCLVIDDSDIPHCFWRQAFRIPGGYPWWDLMYSYYYNGAWSTPVNISKQGGTNVSYYSSAVIDSRNRPHVVWDRQTGSGNWDIFYSYLDSDTWSTPFNISQDPYDSAFPSLAIDVNDHLHLVYRTRITRTPIMYSMYNGSYWSTPVIISDTFPGGLATIVVDSRCNPHVNFKGYYIKLINNQWSYPQRIVNMGDTLCQYFDFAIDSCDNLYMVWEARILINSLPREEIYYCTFNGTLWSNPVNLTQDTTRSWTSKLGNPISSLGVDLVWLDLVPPQVYPWNLNVIYMRLNPVSAGIEEITSLNRVVTTPELKVYPNPTKSLTAIRYTLPAESKVSLGLYDISGRLVKTLIYENKKAGNYSLTFNSKTLPSGIYFLSLQTEEKRIIERLVVTK